MEIKVSVENVDLASVIGEHYVQVGEEDWATRPQTLGQAVAAQIARDLQKDEGYRTLRQRVLEMRDEEIREQVKPLVADAIKSSIQRTNGYGQPTGEPISMTELVIDEVKAWLTKRDGYDRNSPTNVQKIIRAEVDRAIRQELAAVIADEKAAVVAAVRAKAAELIAQAVKEGIGR